MFPSVLRGVVEPLLTQAVDRVQPKAGGPAKPDEKEENEDSIHSTVSIAQLEAKAKFVKAVELRTDYEKYLAGGTPVTFLGTMQLTKILPKNFDLDYGSLFQALYKGQGVEKIQQERVEALNAADKSMRDSRRSSCVYDELLFYCGAGAKVTPETRQKIIEKLKELEQETEKPKATFQEHQKVFDSIDEVIKASKLPPRESFDEALRHIKMTEKQYQDFLEKHWKVSDDLFTSSIKKEGLLEAQKLVEACLLLPEGERAEKQKEALADAKKQMELHKVSMEADAAKAKTKTTEWTDARDKAHVLASKVLERKDRLSDEEFKQVKPILESILEKMPKPVELDVYKELIKSVEAGDLGSTKLDRNTPTNKWPESFMVAGATSQRHVAWGDFYLDNILEALPKTKHLPMAIWSVNADKAMAHMAETLSKKRYIDYQTPASTDSSVNVWDMSVKAKRHVLYIQGEDLENPGRYTYEENLKRSNETYDKFEATIKKHYGNNVTFTRLTKTTEKDIEKAIDDLKKNSGKDDEVLIMLAGHGTTMGLEPGVSEKDKLKEGALIGSFWLFGEGKERRDLSETFLKKQMQKLKDRRGIILLNACYSNSWISKAPEPVTKDFL